MQHFRLSLIITAVCLSIAFYWSGIMGAFIAIILGILEVSLSFDNAVVNASVLKRMDERWQRYFLTWGIMIAVFGMRLIFPILIVSAATDNSFWTVTQMALHDSETYAKHLESAHVQISAFGGMFLIMVFFSFIFDPDKELHWLEKVEEKLSKLGKLEAIEVILALVLLAVIQNYLALELRLETLISGMWGVILYVLVDSVGSFFDDADEGEEATAAIKKAGAMSFLYLEVLDASFSFDGVIGAFAITQDVIIIMLGLAIGAMFVRSLTVYLVRQGTLDQYVFLEHGAHYAIGLLAVLMLISIAHPVPEVITGLTGAALIGLSVYSSIRYREQNGE